MRNKRKCYLLNVGQVLHEKKFTINDNDFNGGDMYSGVCVCVCPVFSEWIFGRSVDKKRGGGTGNQGGPWTTRLVCRQRESIPRPPPPPGRCWPATGRRRPCHACHACHALSCSNSNYLELGFLLLWFGKKFTGCEILLSFERAPVHRWWQRWGNIVITYTYE